MAAFPARAADSDGTLEARQVVIRAPELEVVHLMADTTTHKTEAARITALWQAVKEGRARVISDLTSAADVEGKVFVRQGRHVWLPTELEQDMDRLQMPPTSFEEYFVGTSLDCSLQTAPPTSMDWKGECIPRGPALVKWPVSWLRPFEDFKPTPQKLFPRGWLDFYDTFEESTLGSVNLRGTAMQILAIMPPADQVWPGDRKGRWLDVFLAQISTPGQPPPPPETEPAPESVAPKPAPPPNPEPVDPFAPRHFKPTIKPLPEGQMTLFYGISIPAAEAAVLIHQREPGDDPALLQKLLARVHAGTARLRVCVGSGHHPHSRHVISSTRLHQVPSEMPSIPSAWETRPIGTTLEMDQWTFALHQDLAPPGRTVWPLALDDPQAVMWQPRPRAMKLVAETPGLQGTHLVALLHIPEVMRQQQDNSLHHEESILLFAQHRGQPLPASNDNNPPAFEAEVIVLEMPGTSVDDFEGLPGDPQPGEEDDRFRQLMSRVQMGEVRVAAHAIVVGCRNRLELRIAEEHQHATEFDPPDSKDQPRMRPTALETVPAGTEMEIEVQPDELSPVKMQVMLTFRHSTALPVEPDLPTTLAVAAKDESGPYPPALHPRETWITDKGFMEHVQNNKPFCLGARKPEGIGRKVIHVAYLRVRRLF